MNDARGALGALYGTRFAGSFGMITLLTLLPTYIDLYDPSGVVVGLFTTALTLASTVAVVPLAWAGDRYDKRTVLLAAVGASVVAYAAFSLVTNSAGFIVARFMQGLSIVGTGMLSLALVGELAPQGRRGNLIGRYNAFRMAGGIGGTFGAGFLYSRFGFDAVFGLLVAMLSVAAVGVWWFIDPDETSVAGFAFADLAVNRRILTITSFRAQYAVAVTLVRTWVPIYAGVEAARGGLAMVPLAVSVVIAAEKFTNMLCQPYTGRLSDRNGRALFVFAGGGVYGLVALLVPFTPTLAAPFEGLAAALPVSAALFPLAALNGLLGVADSVREPASMALFADEGEGEGITSSFGIRGLVWRPGNVLAPILGGVLMDAVGMWSVFAVGAAFAFTGVGAFLAILVYDHGPRGLLEW